MAALRSKEATLELDKANLKRGEELRPKGGISKEDLDKRRQTVKVDEAAIEQALEEIHALRAGMGLSPKPEKDKELTDVPAELDQTFSGVQSSLATLLQSAAEFGYIPTSFDSTPKTAFEEFYKQNPSRKLDVIIAKLMPRAPAIQQAKTKWNRPKAICPRPSSTSATAMSSARSTAW